MEEEEYQRQIILIYETEADRNYCKWMDRPASELNMGPTPSAWAPD